MFFKSKRNYLVILLISVFSCNTEVPTKFSEEVLNDTFITLEGDSNSLKDILSQFEGTILIEIWASWCSDCIKGFPKLKELQEKYTDVNYVFLSLDRGEDKWKKGIEKYNLTGHHYFIPSGKKSAFGDFVEIGWIPRYMVVDGKGNIKLYESIEADDPRLIEVLKE